MRRDRGPEHFIQSITLLAKGSPPLPLSRMNEPAHEPRLGHPRLMFMVAAKELVEQLAR